MLSCCCQRLSARFCQRVRAHALSNGVSTLCQRAISVFLMHGKHVLPDGCQHFVSALQHVINACQHVVSRVVNVSSTDGKRMISSQGSQQLGNPRFPCIDSNILTPTFPCVIGASGPPVRHHLRFQTPLKINRSISENPKYVWCFITFILLKIITKHTINDSKHSNRRSINRFWVIFSPASSDIQCRYKLLTTD